MKENILGNDYELLWKVLSVINHKKMFLERRGREKAYISMAKLCRKYDDSMSESLRSIEVEHLEHVGRKTEKFMESLTWHRNMVKLCLEKLPIEDILIELMLMNKDFRDGAMFALWLILTSVKDVLPIENKNDMGEKSYKSFWEKNEKNLEKIWKNRIA